MQGLSGKGAINISKYTILIGNYGSGKTELSLNLVLQAARAGKKTALIDLDIVNPYFRSSAQRKLLEGAGVEVIASDYASTNVDLPIVSPKVQKVFDLDYEAVIFDVGGDPVGATALGRYHSQFSARREELEVLYVVNTRRPLSMTAEDICTMLAQIEDRGRVKVTGLINNANLARETTAENLIEGCEVLQKVSAQLDIPLRYIAGHADVLADFKARQPDHPGELLPIETYMRPAWLDLVD